jgi:hypothetical protein
MYKFLQIYKGSRQERHQQILLKVSVLPAAAFGSRIILSLLGAGNARKPEKTDRFFGPLCFYFPERI